VNGVEREDGPAVGATNAHSTELRERASWLTSVHESGRVLINLGFFIFLSLGSFSKNKKNSSTKKITKFSAIPGKLIEINFDD
jgi:hypothetical protein